MRGKLVRASLIGAALVFFALIGAVGIARATASTVVITTGD
jgi:hypothetical protein